MGEMTENRNMQKYIRGKVKEKRLAGPHIRRGERKLIKRMRNLFIEADKAWCPFPQGARRLFQINTAIQVIVFRLLFATITLSHRSGYRLPAGGGEKSPSIATESAPFNDCAY